MGLYKGKFTGFKGKRKKKISDIKPQQKTVRINYQKDFPQSIADTIAIYVKLYGTPKRYEIGELPRSGNHQYLATGGGGRYLDPKVVEFRKRFKDTVDATGLWRPNGLIASVVIFESKLWVTKERKVREMDSDNKIKTLFDAVAKALWIRDEWIFSHNVFKLPSRREITTVYLWDTGDVVEYKI